MTSTITPMHAEGHKLTIVFTTTISDSLLFIEPVAKELIDQGHEVVYVSGDKNQADRLTAFVSLLPMQRAISPMRDLASLVKWCLFLIKTQPNIIVAGTPKASLLSLTAGRFVKVPKRIYVIHGAVWDGKTGITGKILRIAERVSIYNSTAALAVSQSLANLIKAEKLSNQPPESLGHGSVSGIDLAAYDKVSRPHSETKKLLFIGRLARDKNIDSLISAFDDVRIKSPHTVELHIVGDIDESSPPPTSTINRLNTDEQIKWHGFQSDVVPFLRNANVLAFPSSREGLPQVVLEAQATGLPVAAWSCTGVVDAVSPANRMLLSPIGDIHGLATSILRVINSEQLTYEISQDGRRWVETHFDQNDVVSRTTSFILTGSGCESANN